MIRQTIKKKVLLCIRLWQTTSSMLICFVCSPLLLLASSHSSFLASKALYIKIKISLLLGNGVEEMICSWAKHCEPFVLIRLFSHLLRLFAATQSHFGVWSHITHTNAHTNIYKKTNWSGSATDVLIFNLNRFILNLHFLLWSKAKMFTSTLELMSL